LTYRTVESPIGPLLLAADEDALVGLYMQPTVRAKRLKPPCEGDNAVLERTEEQLAAYFAGELRRFDLPLAPEGTDFQLRVWKALLSTPFGQTQSYGDLARRIGRPRAVRAVGAAIGRNPLPIILPCHRIIGHDGGLTGFGGGLDRKRWLLKHEGWL
jgi:methylated-DNA-[protein]-cysteine S-methyltransferase